MVGGQAVRAELQGTFNMIGAEPGAGLGIDPQEALFDAAVRPAGGDTDIQSVVPAAAAGISAASSSAVGRNRIERSP